MKCKEGVRKASKILEYCHRYNASCQYYLYTYYSDMMRWWYKNHDKNEWIHSAVVLKLCSMCVSEIEWSKWLENHLITNSILVSLFSLFSFLEIWLFKCLNVETFNRLKSKKNKKQSKLWTDRFESHTLTSNSHLHAACLLRHVTHLAKWSQVPLSTQLLGCTAHPCLPASLIPVWQHFLLFNKN